MNIYRVSCVQINKQIIKSIDLRTKKIEHWNLNACHNSLIMSVHYKFKSAISYDTITFDGLHISVKDLKKAILHQKQIGKNTDFDLQVTNAQTNEGKINHRVPAVCLNCLFNAWILNIGFKFVQYTSECVLIYLVFNFFWQLFIEVMIIFIR